MSNANVSVPAPAVLVTAAGPLIAALTVIAPAPVNPRTLVPVVEMTADATKSMRTQVLCTSVASQLAKLQCTMNLQHLMHFLLQIRLIPTW